MNAGHRRGPRRDRPEPTSIPTLFIRRLQRSALAMKRTLDVRSLNEGICAPWGATCRTCGSRCRLACRRRLRIRGHDATRRRGILKRPQTGMPAPSARVPCASSGAADCPRCSHQFCTTTHARPAVDLAAVRAHGRCGQSEARCDVFVGLAEQELLADACQPGRELPWRSRESGRCANNDRQVHTASKKVEPGEADAETWRRQGFPYAPNEWPTSVTSALARSTAPTITDSRSASVVPGA